MNNLIKIKRCKTQEKRMRMIDDSSLRDIVSLGAVFTAFLVIVDYAMIYGKIDVIDTVMDDRIIILMTITIAICLDVPLMIFARALKKYKYKMESKKNVIICSVISIFIFTALFGIFFCFTYVAKDEIYSIKDAAQSVPINSVADYNASVQEQEEPKPESEQELEKKGPIINVFTILTSIIPLLTSLASFLITMISFNPKKEQLRKLRKAKFLAENHLMHIERNLAEERAYGDRRVAIMIAAEYDGLEAFKDNVRIQELIRKQAFRQALSEKCSLDDCNHLIESAKKLNQAMTFDEEPFDEVIDCIIDELESTDSTEPESTNSAEHNAESETSDGAEHNTKPHNVTRINFNNESVQSNSVDEDTEDIGVSEALEEAIDVSYLSSISGLAEN